VADDGDAFVRLVVDLTGTQARLDADLTRIVNTAENNAPTINITVNINTDEARRNLGDLDDDLNSVTRRIDDTDDRSNRLSGTLNRVGGILGSAAQAAAGLATSVGTAGVAAGAAIPLVAGLAVAVESIAPAAAVGVSAMLTMKLAAGTLQLAMVGVEDAIKAAFDPDVKPEELEKALKRLAPEARSFVKELAGMRSEFRKLQIGVQNRTFKDLDEGLKLLGKTTLPVLDDAVDRVGVAFNGMAKGAITSAAVLSADGTLGKALSGSVLSLEALKDIPGQAVTAFGQLAAAAAPSLRRLSEGAASAADRISEKLSTAFESGALEKAIDAAVENIKQLGRIAGNVFGGLKNIIGAVTVDGEGLFGTLEKITQAFQDVTATKGFQDALKALSSVAQSLATNALPILSTLIQSLGPVFTKLEPPITKLLDVLGKGLLDAAKELGPVLETAAGAFGKLVEFATPFIDLALDLVTNLLPVLNPLFETLGRIFDAATPFVEEFTKILGEELQPILDELPGLVESMLTPLAELAERIFPILVDVLREVGPEIVKFAETGADLLAELGPLLEAVNELGIAFAEQLGPALKDVLPFVIDLIELGLKILGTAINEIVIPAVRAITAFLKGDFPSALNIGKEAVVDLKDSAITAFNQLNSFILNIMTQVNGAIIRKIQEAVSIFLDSVNLLISQTGSLLGRLPGIAADALGDLGSLLFRSGRSLVQGFIDGIKSQIGAVADAASSLVGAARDFFPFSPAKKGPFSGSGWTLHSGKAIATALAEGMLAGELAVAAAARGLASAAALGGNGAGSLVLNAGASTPQGLGGFSPSLAGAAAPTVNVFLGNRLLNDHIDTRIDQASAAESRMISQGVRR